MTETYEFERSHEIFIDAAPGVVLDYVSNPNSWPEWIYASHYIESEDRPLKLGDTFRELWHTKSGEAELNWTVTEFQEARLWIGETIHRSLVRSSYATTSRLSKVERSSRVRLSIRRAQNR